MPGVTYRKSGVNIDRANRFVESIKSIAAKTHGPNVLTGIGGFGALFQVPRKGYKRPVFVSSTDGVGTKLKCAIAAGKYDVLGEDLVAMNVNDIVTAGAEPLFFLDYMAVGVLQPDRMRAVLKGVAKGCRLAGCALIGGETAEMPGLYRKDDFDLAGFAVGIADASKLLGPQRVKKGDVIIGLASNGIHANGFSMVRKVLSNQFIKRNAHEVIRPTRIYVQPVLKVARQIQVHAMAHITGGGFYDNIPRALPAGMGAVINSGSWRIPTVFKWIQQKGRITFKEMYRTFNMGVGFVLVLRPKDALKCLNQFSRLGIEAWQIGEVRPGSGVQIQ